MLFGFLALHGEFAVRIRARNNLLGACFNMFLCDGDMCTLLPTIVAKVLSVGTLENEMEEHISPEDVFDVSMVVLAFFGAGE